MKKSRTKLHRKKCVKTLISRDKGKFTKKSPLNRSQRRSGSHEHYPVDSSQPYRDDYANRHVLEGEMKESMRNVEEEGGKDSLGHEEKSKREQRNTEEEISEASKGDDGSEIEKGNVEEGMDKNGDEEVENETEK
ncbi:hypothetical protein OUZ56_017039 [Daphnia magna]|uniref:Uncharacterized protein n=2 Tax=Daphnia magna TaxID=35525 RepID=A0ABR0ASG0_9CRUS|nr:hypothetical protein OUZ56_017039 [Daphnia magna]